MNKNMKKEFEMEYQKIYSRLGISWKKDINYKYEELVKQGLISTGFAQMEMYRLVEKLLNISNTELSKMLILFQEKYNKKISKKELHNYIEQSKKSINGHIDLMNKEIEEKLKDHILVHNESINIYLNNIRENADIAIEELEQKINWYNSGKNIGKIVIINTLLTIIGTIVGVVSLIFNIINFDN